MKIVVAAFEDRTPETVIRLFAEDDRTSDAEAPPHFHGHLFEVALGRQEEPRTVWVGLGPRAGLTGATLGRAMGAAIRWLQGAGIARAAVDLRRYAAHARRAVEGALMGAYQFDTFLPEERKVKARFQALTLLVDRKLVRTARDEAAAGVIWGESANYARSLCDLPGNYVQPETMAESARDLARLHRGLKVTVLEDRDLVEGGFGGVLAVGGGSAHPPRLIVLEHPGDGGPPVALVGKAVTFDAGGLSLKTADKMEDMKFDKAGGCAVLAVMKAAARLMLPRRLVAVIPAAENLPDGHAYRPGDILTLYGGATVEIVNTDAEGRLILADAIAYVRETFEPAEIIDIATLTGAVAVALGQHRAALFCSDAVRTQRWLAAGEACGELVWPMPHDAPYHEQMKGDNAALKNTGGRWGGACTAASFLEYGVGAVPWSHLDIAGVASLTEAKPYLAKGASAFGVRLILDYLMRR